MTTPGRRFAASLAAIALTVGLALTATRAEAQEPPPPPGEQGASEGRPFDGYFATGALAFGILFAVGKSARR